MMKKVFRRTRSDEVAATVPPGKASIPAVNHTTAVRAVSTFDARVSGDLRAPTDVLVDRMYNQLCLVRAQHRLIELHQQQLQLAFSEITATQHKIDSLLRSVDEHHANMTSLFKTLRISKDSRRHRVSVQVRLQVQVVSAIRVPNKIGADCR